MIDPEFLKLLCCPETRQPLAEADAALVLRLNEQIEAGRLRNRAGRPVTRKCDRGLVRQDGRYLYPICQEIPILIVPESIPLGDDDRPSPARV